ncbi:ATP-binding protein [Candidatus Woesearchaeota archaeon]|nr:ATP-binding protein [Candidatus Woesearchaeota archaeon]
MEEVLLDWKQVFGWNKNPFREVQSKAGFSKEKEQLNLYLMDNTPVIAVQGHKDTGKSTLLDWVYQGLAKKSVWVKKLSHPESKQEIVEALFAEWKSLLFKPAKLARKDTKTVSSELMKRLGGRHAYLVVPEAQALSPKILEFLFKLSNDRIHLIISSTRPVHVKTKIVLGELTPSYALKILEGRITQVGGNGTYPFTDTVVRNLVRESNNSISSFLDLCEDRVKKIALKEEAKRQLSKKSKIRKKDYAREEDFSKIIIVNPEKMQDSPFYFEEETDQDAQDIKITHNVHETEMEEQKKILDLGLFKISLKGKAIQEQQQPHIRKHDDEDEQVNLLQEDYSSIEHDDSDKKVQPRQVFTTSKGKEMKDLGILLE